MDEWLLEVMVPVAAVTAVVTRSARPASHPEPSGKYDGRGSGEVWASVISVAPDTNPIPACPPPSRAAQRRADPPSLGVCRWFWSVVDGATVEARTFRRVLATTGALIALLSQARSGTSTARLVLLSAVFVVAATVWLHAQYVDDLDAGPRVLNPWVGVVLLLTGVLLLAAGARWSPLLAVGVMALYLGIAFLMTWARHRTLSPSVDPQLSYLRRRQFVRRLAAMSVGSVLAGAGLLVFSTTDAVNVGLALLSVSMMMVVLPAFVLLGEWLVRDWTWRSGVFLARAGVTAAIVLAVLIAVSWREVSGVLAIGELVLVALVVAAMVGTHVDFVGVMLVAALLGVTAQPATAPANLVTTAQGGKLSGRVFVSLGDSYMSGEGASVFFKDTDSGENECRQAPTAWARQASLLGRFDSMLFLACSGALTQHVLSTDSVAPAARYPELAAPPTAVPQKGTERTQLDAALDELNGITPELVVVSVGGNDAGFSGVGSMCLAPGKCDEKHHIWDADGNFAQLDQQLNGVYDDISEKFPNTPVVVIPYPDPILAGEKQDCGDLLLTSSEAKFVRRFLLGSDETEGPGFEPRVIGLNPVIRRQAAAHGFYYAEPMINALGEARLQLCDPLGDSPGLHFIGLRSIQGIASQRFNPKNWTHSSLHPNQKGHAALLHSFARWYEETLRDQVSSGAAEDSADNRGRRLAKRTTPRPAATINAESPGCTISRKSGCRAEAKRWIREQIPWTLRSWAGLGLAVTVVSAAILSVAWIAWRRKRWEAQPTPFP